MANKDKILAAAQKQLQKNNIPRAIKEYRKVLEIDAKDVRSRQKLAELYGRSGNADDALKEYETVAAYYADNTFYLKAIAVYKQMQKLAPDNSAFTLKLAKLNEQQGLIGNALSEYRVLLEHYNTMAEHDEAVKILTHMQELDPENITIGMRIAEFYASIDNHELAEKEYLSVEQRIRELGNYTQLQKFYEHFMAIWPGNAKVGVGYGEAMVKYGEPLGGVQYLTKLQRQYPEDVDVLSALANGFHKCSEFKHELECLLRLVEWQPENVDFWYRLFQAAMDSEEYSQGFELLEKGKDRFFTAERVADLKPFYEKLREVLPDNQEILASLHVIYEHLGEGEKLFDVLSSELGADEAPSDQLAIDDFDTISFESSSTVNEPVVADDLEFDELEFDIVRESPAPPSDDASFDDISFDIVEEPSVEQAGIVDPFTAAATSAPPVDLKTDLEEADFYLQQGLLDEAEEVCRRLDQACPDNAEVQKRLGLVLERRGTDVSPAVTAPTPSSVSDVSVAVIDGEDVSVEISSETFDLDLDSDDSFMAPLENFDLSVEEDDIDSSLELSLGSQDDGGGNSAENLADSQRGIQTVIGDEDTESAYNLGVAYKEMGLYDDAIVEFNKAMQSPARKIDGLSLKAACFIEQQQFDSAEEVLTLGLSDSALSIEDRVILYYETGLLYEAWHRYADALSSYQVVADNDASFRNVSAKIVELKELVDGDSDPTTGVPKVSYV
ncbi:MAG: tetratricopeptide repeat protein [Desulfuromonas sp.]|nr:tetratricopeptide repeat protein [Desulfuromonas sp.]